MRRAAPRSTKLRKGCSSTAGTGTTSGAGVSTSAPLPIATERSCALRTSTACSRTRLRARSVITFLTRRRSLTTAATVNRRRCAVLHTFVREENTQHELHYHNSYQVRSKSRNDIPSRVQTPSRDRKRNIAGAHEQKNRVQRARSTSVANPKIANKSTQASWPSRTFGG